MHINIYLPNLYVIYLFTCLLINVIQVSTLSLHTSVSVVYAAANQFACVSLFKDTERGFEIHCTQRRKCPPNHESRISCMFHRLKSCNLYLDTFIFHPNSIVQAKKKMTKEKMFRWIFQENKKNSNLIDTFLCAL